MNGLNNTNTDYLPLKEVGGILRKGGTSGAYKVLFDKQDGTKGEILGVLIEPIAGELKMQIVLLNAEGKYKSFNPTRVTSIEFKGGV